MVSRTFMSTAARDSRCRWNENIAGDVAGVLPRSGFWELDSLHDFCTGIATQE
jgi:hypothetical protein